MTNGRCPAELKSQIISQVPEGDFKIEYMQTQDVYNLRRGRILVKKTIPETKYETLTFNYFFPKLLNSFKHFDYFARNESFKTQINLKMDENLKIVLDKFPKFDIKYTTFFKKKNKKLGKIKRTKIK